MIKQNILLAVAFLFLGLEHLGVPIPGWVTGVLFLIVAILMLV